MLSHVASSNLASPASWHQLRTSSYIVSFHGNVAQSGRAVKCFQRFAGRWFKSTLSHFYQSNRNNFMLIRNSNGTYGIMWWDYSNWYSDGDTYVMDDYGDLIDVNPHVYK